MKINNFKIRMMGALMMIMLLAGSSTVFADSTALVPDRTYDKYQIITFTDTQGGDLKIYVSADRQEKNFNLRFNYYGLNADLDVETLSGQKYHVTNGEFFQTNGQTVVEKAIADGQWISLR